MEFAEVRAYEHGDDFRSIDWNVSARLNSPYVKTFIEERELTLMLVVDQSGSTRFGEPQTKAFAAYGRQQADRLRAALDAADADIRIALTHYSPVADTLVGEPPEIYPFLGSYLLGDAIDDAGAAPPARARACRIAGRNHPGRSPGAQRRPSGDQDGVRDLHGRPEGRGVRTRLIGLWGG